MRGQDIICLQEVTTNWQASNGDDQPEEIASALQMYNAFAPGFEVDVGGKDADGRLVNERRGFGNMVLSRWPILYSRAYSLPRPPVKPEDVPEGFPLVVDLPRVALEAVVDVPGWPLRMFSIHLSHLPGAQRLAQIDVLSQLVHSVAGEVPLWEPDPSIAVFVEGSPAPPIPGDTVLCGDFNCEPGHPEYAELKKLYQDGWVCAGNDRADGGSCVETDGRVSTLDCGFFTDGIAETVVSVRTDVSNKSSNHFPLFFELDL